MGLENVPRCQHVKVNGTQCGSPALRRRRRCYFHEQVRVDRARTQADVFAQRRFELPVLEDANSVQVALMKVMELLACGRMDHKTAGLMLYALQTATVNLRNTDFEVEQVTDIVIDRDTVNATSINGPQWFEDDFEGEAEDEEAAENEAEGEDSADAVQVKAEPVPKAAANSVVKHVSSEKARMVMQGIVRNWLLETVGEKPQ
jgi:hypothetical protein